MAVTSSNFEPGQLSTAQTFNELKQLINTEVNSTNRREQGYIIVNDVPKESINYATQTNNLIGALNKIKQQYSEVLKDETLIAPWLELYTKVELLRTTYPQKISFYPDNAGCGAACTGLCSGCTGTCLDTCTSCQGCTGCTGSCSGGCSGCTGSCAGGCYTGCSGGCQSSCGGCGFSCGNSCGNSTVSY